MPNPIVDKLFLRQGTSVDVSFGPFVDNYDGCTAETALSITVDLFKGVTLSSRHSATSITHISKGMYSLNLDATDTNTLGLLTIYALISGALPVWKEYIVISQEAYDALADGVIAAYQATTAIEFEYTLTETDGTTPVPDALVQIYSTDASHNPLRFITKDRTDNWGKQTFYLQPGTYLFVSTKAGMKAYTDVEEVA